MDGQTAKPRIEMESLNANLSQVPLVYRPYYSDARWHQSAWNSVGDEEADSKGTCRQSPITPSVGITFSAL